MAALNVCSLFRKLDEIVILLQSSEIDVLCLNETWLNESIDDVDLMIPGYTFIRNDRGNMGIRTGGEGGTMIYMQDNRAFQPLPEWNLVSPEVEWCWTKLLLKGTRPTYICSVYRPPDGNIQGFLELLESKVLDIYNEGISDIIILGDCNIDLAKRGCPKSREYKNYITNCGLTQIITDYTRVTLYTKTTIDHIITNREDLYHTLKVLDLGISDHHLIYTNRKKQKLPRTISYINCRSYRNFIDKGYQADIDQIDWSQLYVIENANRAAELFASEILKVVDSHAPFIRLKLRDHGPAWLNYDVLSPIDGRKYHSRNFNQCPCREHLYKEGDRTDPSNYRPISILPAAGKILERVAHNQLYAYCQRLDIFTPCQSGFRKAHSTTTIVCQVLSWRMKNSLYSINI